MASYPLSLARTLSPCAIPERDGEWPSWRAHLQWTRLGQGRLEAELAREAIGLAP